MATGKNSNGKYISLGNIITIVAVLASAFIVWGSTLTRLAAIETNYMPREVIETKFEFIKAQLSEIKEMLKP
jgi:hypothetical protein|tara:strand:- start:2466 stop:2681 length:216 start_codon:yes stop_codon:yes gene_type:complete